MTDFGAKFLVTTINLSILDFKRKNAVKSALQAHAINLSILDFKMYKC